MHAYVAHNHSPSPPLVRTQPAVQACTRSATSLPCACRALLSPGTGAAAQAAIPPAAAATTATPHGHPARHTPGGAAYTHGEAIDDAARGGTDVHSFRGAIRGFDPAVAKATTVAGVSWTGGAEGTTRHSDPHSGAYMGPKRQISNVPRSDRNRSGSCASGGSDDKAPPAATVGLAPCRSITRDRFEEASRAHAAAMAQIAAALCSGSGGPDAGGGAAADAAVAAAQPHAAAVVTAVSALDPTCGGEGPTQAHGSVRCDSVSEAAAVWAVMTSERHAEAARAAVRGCGACAAGGWGLSHQLGSAVAAVEVTGEAFKLAAAAACGGGREEVTLEAYVPCAAAAYTATWVNVRALAVRGLCHSCVLPGSCTSNIGPDRVIFWLMQSLQRPVHPAHARTHTGGICDRGGTMQ